MKAKLISAFLVLVLVIAGVGAGAAYWLQRYLDTPLALSQPELVQLVPGSSLRSVANGLEQRGILSHSRALSLYARYQGQAQFIKAGEYRLEPGLTPRTLLALLVSGKVVQYQVTLVEGKTLTDWRQVLAAAPQLKQEIKGLTDQALLEAVGAAEPHPEGLFYPDTYSYRRGDSDLSILKRAYGRMQSVLADEWASRSKDIPLTTPYEALILASIVERETGVPEERPQIAGVFTRRLQKGMRLQTDPTVIYGMGDRYQGNLKRRDLLEKTPYNTYRIDGLPPTPIAMPGRAAIHAALNPAEGDTLYFVARGDGSHYFSRTLQEHNKAVREYQVRKRRSDYRSSPQQTVNQEQQ